MINSQMIAKNAAGRLITANYVAPPLIATEPPNIITFPEAFDNAFWTKNNSSVVADQVPPPTGGANAADLIRESTTNTAHTVARNGQAVIPGAVYSQSVFAKAEARSVLTFNLTDTPFGTGSEAVFDLVNGVCQTYGVGKASMENWGNGWWRCKWEGMRVTGTGNSSIQFGLAPSYPWNTNTVYLGDGVSGLYLWGATFTQYPVVPGYFPNTMLVPEAFNDSYWLKTGSTITPNSAMAPNGQPVADLLTEDTSTGTHRMTHTGIPVTVGLPYSFSIYAKANGRSNILFNVGDTQFGSGTSHVVFNLATGVGQTAGVGVATMEYVGDGWWRCMWSNVVCIASGTSGLDCYVKQDSSIVFGSATYQGDGKSGAYFWGAKMEQSAAASPYVPIPAAIDASDNTPTNASSALLVDTGAINPNNYNAGWPYVTNGSLCVAVESAVVDYVAGIGISSGGKIAVTYVNPIWGHVAGIPIDIEGRICCVAPVVELSGFSEGFDEGFGS